MLLSGVAPFPCGLQLQVAIFVQWNRKGNLGHEEERQVQAKAVGWRRKDKWFTNAVPT